MNPERRRALKASAASLTMIAIPTFAQASYPVKPITLVVPFPTGSGGDSQGRLIAELLRKELGQPVIVENRGGAGGNIGAAYAAKAAPDGYTLLYGTNGTHAINRALYKNLGFDSIQDFEPIVQFSKIATMVVVRTDFPADSFRDLISVIRANPNKYTFGSGGNGTTSHLAGVLLCQLAGLQMVHLPYTGNAASLKDLIGGEISLMIDVMPITLPMVKAGRLKALAIGSPARSRYLSELPTIQEGGVPGFNVVAWDGLWAPAKTPVSIVRSINGAINKQLVTAELQVKLSTLAIEPAGGASHEFRMHVASEVEKWGAAVKRSGAVVG